MELEIRVINTSTFINKALFCLLRWTEVGVILANTKRPLPFYKCFLKEKFTQNEQHKLHICMFHICSHYGWAIYRTRWSWATFDSQVRGGKEKKEKKNKYFSNVCIKAMRYHIATHCQYSAVKNNLKRLPAFTKQLMAFHLEPQMSVQRADFLMFKFSVSFSCVTWNTSFLNHCGETRGKK